MVAIIIDPQFEQEIIAQRRASGADKFDEVWDGVYVMSPLANNEHQKLATRLGHALFAVIEEPGLGIVFNGANVSTESSNWTKNYRCPDVLVFLNDNPAEDRDTHWFGGPDFAIEVMSPGDRSYEKLPFYAEVNTREVLIIERDPWLLVLFRLQDGMMQEVGRSQDASQIIVSVVMPVTFCIDASNVPTVIAVRHADSREWKLSGR